MTAPASPGVDACPPARRLHLRSSGGTTCVHSVARSRSTPRGRDRRFRSSLGRAARHRPDRHLGHRVRRDDTTEDIPMTGGRRGGQRREYRMQEPSLFKMPDLLKDTPQSITIIPQELMREQAVFSLRDAAAQRQRPQPQRRRGRLPGRQPHPPRLLRAQRHLPRRHPRLGLVHARRLQPRSRSRCSRGRRRPCSGAAPPAASSTR